MKAHPVFPSLQRRLARWLLRLLTGLAGLTAVGALGGPHHFWAWQEGTVLRVYPNQHLFTLAVTGESQKPLRIEWSARTHFSSDTNVQTVAPSSPTPLSPGQKVRVEAYHRWRNYVARQVISSPTT